MTGREGKFSSKNTSFVTNIPTRIDERILILSSN